MNLSSASNALSAAPNDPASLSGDGLLSSPPRTRRSKRNLPNFQPDDEANPYAKIYRAYDNNCASHRRLHSPQRVRRHLNATSSTTDDSSMDIDPSPSQDLLTQPPEVYLPPNIQDDNSPIHNDYIMGDDERQIVIDAMDANWGISRPHPFQVKAIHHGLFNASSSQYIIAKTGYGKSVIPATIASLRRGVALYMVPLLGLGSDLVNKSERPERGIEAYHVDEHKADDAKLLATRLLNLTSEEAQYTTIQLFASPKALLPSSSWAPVFRQLSRRGFISVFCIDEAHSINLQKDFRPDFIAASSFMMSLRNNQPTSSAFIAMSATLTQQDQTQLSRILNITPDLITWTDMNRRRIFFDVQVTGNPTLSIRSSLKNDFQKHPDIKAIVYTNSKKKAEESIMPMIEKVLNQCKVPGEAMSLTGDSGVMEKTYIMECFSVPVDADSIPGISNAKGIAATAAANCGVSCRDCHRGYRCGPPPHMHDHVQEFGRVDRNQNKPAGFNRYEVHSDFKNVISMYVRAMQQHSH